MGILKVRDVIDYMNSIKNKIDDDCYLTCYFGWSSDCSEDMKWLCEEGEGGMSVGYVGIDDNNKRIVLYCKSWSNKKKYKVDWRIEGCKSVKEFLQLFDKEDLYDYDVYEVLLKSCSDVEGWGGGDLYKYKCSNEIVSIEYSNDNDNKCMMLYGDSEFCFG